MSKKYIGKKLIALAVIGAAVGGAIAFFKKFEKENEDDHDYNSFEAPDVDGGFDEDAFRNYTTISGEKDDDGEETDATADVDETADSDQNEIADDTTNA